MKSGVIFSATSETQLPEIRKTVSLPENHKYDSLLEAIDIRRTVEVPSVEHDAQQGKIAAERVVESKEVRIDDENISEYDAETKTVVSTDFLYLQDHFLVISNKSGKFAVGVINEHTEVQVDNANIDLDQFITERIDSGAEIDPWKIGFYGKSGSVENGVVHGNSVLDDTEIGGILDMTNKNQLGLDYEYDTAPIRMFAAESGYAEMYQPNDYTSSQFAEYLVDQILPVLKLK